ncbi:hypothetical protein [Haloarcula sp. CBA1129]|uniref:hypothetical protein n=1 Tax=Haloarcula sp. CBA1129 TaxID=1853684 RepID=UPI001244C4C5|nr:hypothetical protein [Haloarcula sp. CBA1129]KAA9399692.1 hypothetical protein Har1129_16285 [Haloarcula sp. CBA1129]
MSQSGARQWRVECDCIPEVAEARDTQHWERMHSQVSKANAGHFVSENRLAADLDEDELRQRHEQAHGALVVCNVCGKLKEVAG